MRLEQNIRHVDYLLLYLDGKFSLTTTIFFVKFRF